jgi:hypothetical protein
MEVSSNNDAEMKVLKIGECPSLSGRSSLTYHIGCRSDLLDKAGDEFNEAVSFRIHANSGSGLFSDQWVAVSALKTVFDKEKSKDAVTSSSLNSVFAGRSVNTAGFILAVLKAEGLVVHMEDKRRYYQCTSTDQFFAAMKILADSINACDTINVPDTINVGEPVMPIEGDDVSAAKPMQIGKPKKR